MNINSAQILRVKRDTNSLIDFSFGSDFCVEKASPLRAAINAKLGPERAREPGSWRIPGANHAPHTSIRLHAICHPQFGPICQFIHLVSSRLVPSRLLCLFAAPSVALLPPPDGRTWKLVTNSPIVAPTDLVHCIDSGRNWSVASGYRASSPDGARSGYSSLIE